MPPGLLPPPAVLVSAVGRTEQRGSSRLHLEPNERAEARQEGARCMKNGGAGSERPVQFPAVGIGGLNTSVATRQAPAKRRVDDARAPPRRRDGKRVR